MGDVLVKLQSSTAFSTSSDVKIVEFVFAKCERHIKGEPAIRCREHPNCRQPCFVAEVPEKFPESSGSSQFVLLVVAQDCMDHWEGWLQA